MVRVGERVGVRVWVWTRAWLTPSRTEVCFAVGVETIHNPAYLYMRATGKGRVRKRVRARVRQRVRSRPRARQGEGKDVPVHGSSVNASASTMGPLAKYRSMRSNLKRRESFL